MQLHRSQPKVAKPKPAAAAGASSSASCSPVAPGVAAADGAASSSSSSSASAADANADNNMLIGQRLLTYSHVLTCLPVDAKVLASSRGSRQRTAPWPASSRRGACHQPRSMPRWSDKVQIAITTLYLSESYILRRFSSRSLARASSQECPRQVATRCTLDCISNSISLHRLLACHAHLHRLRRGCRGEGSCCSSTTPTARPFTACRTNSAKSFARANPTQRCAASLVARVLQLLNPS